MALEEIGPYKFEGVLGRGGMGTVYRARHRESGELHAVKVLAQNFTREEHFRNRFESEIRALIKLDHPNIVRILSYGQSKGTLFFAMELVEGNSLFQAQKNGRRFDWREILMIAKQVSRGLRHAHDRGIIHRDLKPGNLLQPLSPDGQPSEIKITDFGIAKRFGSSQNTGHNVLGTMDFMSPEQAKGQPVTARSDLYSLGTVMYTLLSGRPPFTANSVEESLRNLTRVPAPHINSVVPTVPDEIDRLIQKLMSKRPEDRIPTAQALLYKIQEIEGKLRETSKADTSEIPSQDFKDETFELAQPGDIRTQVNTEHLSPRAKDSPANHHPVTVESTELNEFDPIASKATEIDYFNTVTDHIRKQQSFEIVQPEEHHQRGLWPVLIMLLLVIGLAGFGIYEVYKPPSAEDLYAKIEANVIHPNQAIEEMDLFLQHYPDDPRSGRIAKMYEIGKAVQHYNRLTRKLMIRAGMPGENRLSVIERQFLEIVELAQKNQVMAKAKMDAFVTVHENDPELSKQDQECVQAAAYYEIKLKNDQRASDRWNLRKIRSAMRNAETSVDVDQAIAIYESIIALYKDISWSGAAEGLQGRNLINQAEMTLEDLKRKKAEQAESKSETPPLPDQADDSNFDPDAPRFRSADDGPD
jgi:serine/threonine protein kinase